MEENNVQKNNSVSGFGVTSLVFGIVSIITLPFIIISIFCAIFAIIFGIISYYKSGKNGIGLSGLAIGIVSLLITFLLFLFLNVLDISLFYVPDWY